MSRSGTDGEGVGSHSELCLEKHRAEMETFEGDGEGAKVKDEAEFVGKMIRQEIEPSLCQSPQAQLPSPPPLLGLQPPIGLEQDGESSNNNFPEEMGKDGEWSVGKEGHPGTSSDQCKIPNSLASKFVCTIEQFTPSALKLWSMVFNREKILSETRIHAWYARVGLVVELYQSLLDSALSVVENNNKQNARVKLRKMKPAEIATAKDQTAELLRKREREAKKLGLDLSTTSGLMISETSPFQLFVSYEFHKSYEMRKKLTQQLKDEGDSMELEDPLYWIPTSSSFPFNVFQRILKLRLNSKKIDMSLSTEALKVRYVEFMAKAFGGKGYNNHLQLVAGVFTAFGPNLFTYPARVIELLQATTLLNNELGLPKFKSAAFPKTFPPLDSFTINLGSKNPRDSQFPQLPQISLTDGFTSRKPSTRSTSPDARPGPSHSPLALLRNAIPKNSANLVPLGSRAEAESGGGGVAASLQPYAAWFSASERGLRRVGLEVLSETGFQEVWNQHLTYSQEPMNNDFMLGVLTGISISLKSQEEQYQEEVFQPEALPPIPPEPEPRSVPRLRQNGYGVAPLTISPPEPNFPHASVYNDYYDSGEFSEDTNFEQCNYYNQGYLPHPGPRHPRIKFSPKFYWVRPSQRQNLTPQPPPLPGQPPLPPVPRQLFRHNGIATPLPPQRFGHDGIAPPLPPQRFGHDGISPPLPPHGFRLEGIPAPLPPQHFRQDGIQPPQRFRQDEIATALLPQYYRQGGVAPPLPPQLFRQDGVAPLPPPLPPPVQNPPLPTTNHGHDSWNPEAAGTSNSSRTPQPLPQPDSTKPHVISQQEIPIKRPRPPPPPPPIISSIKIEGHDKMKGSAEEPGEDAEESAYQAKKRKVSGSLNGPANVENGSDAVVFDYSHGQ